MNKERRDWAQLSARRLAPPPPRLAFPERPFRTLPRFAALAVLVLLVAGIIWSGATAPVSPIDADPSAPLSAPNAAKPAAAPSSAPPPGDVALHARVVQRMVQGENYYLAALAEHRALDRSLHLPGAVRLPPLSWLNAKAGRGLVGLLVVALLLANLAAWYRTLHLRVSTPERIGAVVLAALAGVVAFTPSAGLLHEAVAGLLLSLALAIYRPQREWAALLVLAAALAVNELAAPFALLWLAFALVEQRAEEIRALLILVGVFALALALHHLAVAAQLLPGDRVLAPMTEPYSLRLALAAVIRATPLTSAPAPFASMLAVPLALLPLLGWIALGGRLGLFAALWFVALTVPMVLSTLQPDPAWPLLLLPAYAIGIALVPRALVDLGHAALSRAPLASRPPPG